MTVWEANPKVIEVIKEHGNLMTLGKLKHSYPHCWRCKEPVIFRATTQWFISMEHDALRNKALNAIENDVRWIPAWGQERIYNMIANRPDWCISRQRMWGVPIVALLCESCGEAWFDADWAYGIVEKFANYPTGCDYWFDTPIEDIAPKGLTCPHCQGTSWKKETDILDVWFDSGTSFAAVVERRPECRYPADMYLEGSDQHRGWFHSSLLASMGTRGARTIQIRAYPRLRCGRRRQKNVQIRGQRGGAARNHRSIRRGNPAHVGRQCGLYRGYPHLRRNHEPSGGRPTAVSGTRAAIFWAISTISRRSWLCRWRISPHWTAMPWIRPNAPTSASSKL